MLVSYQELTKMGITYHPKYLRLKVKRGQFPKPTKGGRARNQGAFHWEKSDVDKWIEARKKMT